MDITTPRDGQETPKMQAEGDVSSDDKSAVPSCAEAAPIGKPANDNDIECQIDASAEEIFTAMKNRVSDEDMERIRAAYHMAREAHKNQRRKSGEPYIIHPIAVARIVAIELSLGANPVIAAFLHDVVEDTATTLDDIEHLFGSDVAFLVRVVTKQKKDHYEMSKQLDNFKQILDSVRYDIRAILVKLSDRLHNMRTLDSMRPDKQMKIAGETDYFYAPLANRLGLYRIKTELENLSFRYRCPHEYANMVEVLRQDQLINRESLDTFVGHIREVLDTNGINARIEIEYRMPYSIWRKMQKNNKDFWHTEHRHFVSIIFANPRPYSEKDMCLRLYSLLTDRFREKPGGIANYVDNPKGNGYRCFHVKLLSDHGQWEEVHISSEQMVHDSRFGCLTSRSEMNISLWLDRFRSVLKDLAQQSQTDRFLENVATSFYNDDIMVFTPQGRPIILPKRATVLDFAFEIHSMLGRHAKFGRVNGKVCSIKTELSRGDCVEINTDDNIEPQPDWLDHVLTYKAKRFLRNFLSSRPKQTYCRCAQCHPIPGDEVIGFRETNGEVTIHKRNCSTVIRLATQYGDSIVSVDFKEQPDQLFESSAHIKAIDRYHLLSDIIDCITDKLGLSIDSLRTVTQDAIVDCTVRFYVHSFRELNYISSHLYRIDGVEEVQVEDVWDNNNEI